MEKSGPNRECDFSSPVPGGDPPQDSPVLVTAAGGDERMVLQFVKGEVRTGYLLRLIRARYGWVARDNFCVC